MQNNNIVTVVSAVLARPEVLNLSFKGPAQRGNETLFQTKQIEEMGRWGWVDIFSLTNCINSTMSDIGALKSDMLDYRQNDVFDRFGLLNNQDEGKALHTYIIFPFSSQETSITGQCRYVINGEHPGHAGDKILVPAGWANSIIDLVRSGLVRVESELHHPTGYYTIGITTNDYKWVLYRTIENRKWSIRRSGEVPC